MKQKLISILIILVMLMVSSGCGNQIPASNSSSGLSSIGRVEDMNRMLFVKKLKDGNMLMAFVTDYSYNCVNVYKSGDSGMNWELYKAVTSDELGIKDNLYGITSMDINDSYEIIVSYDVMNYDYSKNRSVVRYLDKKDALYDSEDQKDLIGVRLFDDKVVINTGSKVVVENSDGNVLYDIKVEKCIDTFLQDDKLFILSADGCFMYQDGDCKDKYSIIYDNLSEELQRMYDDDTEKLIRNQKLLLSGNALYICCRDKLYIYYEKNGILQLKYDENGDFADGVLTFDDNIYLFVYDPESAVTNICTDKNLNSEEMFLIKNEDIEVQTQTDAQSDTESKDTQQLSGKLEIYSLNNIDCVEYAVRQFEKHYDELEVTYTVGIDNENTTAVDAMKTLNSRLLTGNGPDVIIMDGMDIDSMIDNDVLLDLNDIYDEHKDDLLDTVSNTFRNDQGLYAIPARFKTYMIFCPAGTEKEFEDIEGIKAHIERSDAGINDLNINSSSNIMEEFFPMYQNRVFDNKTVDVEQLKVFYKDMGDLYHLCEMHNNEWDDEFAKADGDQFDTFDGLNVYPNYNNFTGTVIDNWPDITIGPLDSQVGLIHCISVKDYNKENGVDYNLLSWKYNGEEWVYVPCVISGIVSNSQNIPAAEAFINEILCGDCSVYENSELMKQSSAGYEKYGMSVSRRSRKKLSDKYGKMIYVLSPNAGLFERLEVRTVLSEEEYRDIEEIYANVTEASYVDAVISDIIKEKLRAYIKGEVNLDTAVEAASEEINLYLKEK